MSVQTGDLIIEHTKFKLFNPMTWLSLLVRLFTWFKYNHGGIIVVEDDKAYVVHTKAKTVMVSLAEFNDTKKKKIAIYRLKNKDFNKEAVASRAKSLVGTPYDVISLIFYQPIYIIFGIWLGRKEKKAGKTLYCSELYAYIFKRRFPNWYKMSVADIIRTGKLYEVYKQ